MEKISFGLHPKPTEPQAEPQGEPQQIPLSYCQRSLTNTSGSYLSSCLFGAQLFNAPPTPPTPAATFFHSFYDRFPQIIDILYSLRSSSFATKMKWGRKVKREKENYQEVSPTVVGLLLKPRLHSAQVEHPLRTNRPTVFTCHTSVCCVVFLHFPRLHFP